MALITRTEKGSPLTTAEIDANWVLCAPLVTTVAGLPTASAANKGFKAAVTDADSATPAFCSTTVGHGGSTNIVPVFSDGTIWRFG